MQERFAYHMYFFIHGGGGASQKDHSDGGDADFKLNSSKFHRPPPSTRKSTVVVKVALEFQTKR